MLPSVYANKIDKEIKNNTEYYRGDEKIIKKKDLRELKSCFDRKGYANKLSVMLEMKDGSKRSEKLILCIRDYFVNIDNEKILFDDIVDYEIKK